MEETTTGERPLPLAPEARQGFVAALPRRGPPQSRPCPASVSRSPGGIQAKDSGR